MPKFLIDENMPQSLALALRRQMHEALDVRDCGLRGAPDSEVFAFAQREHAVLISADMGFGNILDFPLGSHGGIVIAHFPNDFSVPEINTLIAQVVQNHDAVFYQGNLVIIEPGTIRIRRHGGAQTVSGTS